MRSLFTFTAPTRRCSYLPSERATLEYELVAAMSPAEYLRRMLEGWRRFGHMLFHPACAECQQCRPLRIDVERFRPDRSQRRSAAANADVELRIERPAVTREKLDLYDRYHAFQEGEKGTIEAGKLADLVVLGRDIFDPNEKDRIGETKVDVTVVGGKLVFERKK